MMNECLQIVPCRLYTTHACCFHCERRTSPHTLNVMSADLGNEDYPPSSFSFLRVALRCMACSMLFPPFFANAEIFEGSPVLDSHFGTPTQVSSVLVWLSTQDWKRGPASAFYSFALAFHFCHSTSCIVTTLESRHTPAASTHSAQNIGSWSH
jgi:hypothetical protein